MRWQTTALLAAVLVALGAFYYVYEVRGGPERAKTAAQKGRLWPAEASDVTEVELRRGRETLRLRREGDGWQIVEPVKARGDRSRIDETLVTLATARVDRAWRLTRPLAVSADAETIGDFLDKLQQQKVKDFVAEAPKSLVPYGLDRPVRVAIHTGRDKERATKELLFGAVDSVKQIVYAMRPGEASG